MFAPRVYVSMIGALSVFAVVTFILTGALWTTVWQTVLCALLLQIGYFIAVFALVVKADRDRRKTAQPAASVSVADDKEPKAIHVPRNTGHFNS